MRCWPILILILSLPAYAPPRYLTRSGPDGASYGLRLEMETVADLLHVETPELFKLVGAGAKGQERFIAATTPGQKALENLFRAVLDENDHVVQLGPRGKIGNPSPEQLFQGRVAALGAYCQLQIKKPQMRWIFDDEALFNSLRPVGTDGEHTVLNHGLLTVAFTLISEAPTENPNDVIKLVGTARQRAIAKARKSGVADPPNYVDSVFNSSPVGIALKRAHLEAAARNVEPTFSQTFVRELDRAFHQAATSQPQPEREKVWQGLVEAGTNIHSAADETFSNPRLGFAFQQIPRDMALQRFGDESNMGGHGHGYWQAIGGLLSGREYDSIREASERLGGSLTAIERPPRYRAELPTGARGLKGEMEEMGRQALENLAQWDQEIGLQRRAPLERLATIFVALSAMAPFEHDPNFDRNGLTAELVLNYLAAREHFPLIAFNPERTRQVQHDIQQLADKYRTNKKTPDAGAPQVQRLYAATTDLIIDGMKRSVRTYHDRQIIHIPADHACRALEQLDKQEPSER